MGETWIESMVHRRSNNQNNWNSVKDCHKCDSSMEDTSKKQRKITFFRGKNKVLQAGGDTGDVTKISLHLQGCHGQTLALVPCAEAKLFFPVKFLYSSCKVPPPVELYRNYTGTLQWTLQELYSVTDTVVWSVITNHNVHLWPLKWSSKVRNLIKS